MSQIACISRRNKNRISYETLDISQITTPITPPSGDGVYTGDNSPPIGTYKWPKSNLTYAVVLAQGQKINDIPNTHDLVVAVNRAYTSWGLFCPVKFSLVPITQNPDMTIAFSSTDPLFTQFPDATGYTYFPGTKPNGAYTTVLNAKEFWSDGPSVNFSYDINNTLRHELGHSIGCVHTQNQNDLMYPFYTSNIRQSLMDIYQVQFMYGSRIPPVNPIEVDGFFAWDGK